MSPELVPFDDVDVNNEPATTHATNLPLDGLRTLAGELAQMGAWSRIPESEGLHLAITMTHRLVMAIVRLQAAGYLATLAGGLAVLAWPEQDSRMFVTLSERHGPSTLDLVGLAFILTGYLPMVARVWTRRVQLHGRFGAFWPWMIALVLLSWGGIVAGLVAEQEPVLWASVTVSTFVHALLIAPAFRRAPTNV